MLRKLKNKIKNRIVLNNSIENQLDINRGKQIQFYNFWDQPFDEIYWYRFLHARPDILNKTGGLKFGFFSVFGDRSVLKIVDTDVNIFYSAENVKKRFNYIDHFLTEKKIDLAMGFEYFEHEKYIRFPNWMDVFFLESNEIEKICQKLRYPFIDNKTRFACCIASHDQISGAEGLRGSIVDALNQIEEVSCPGKFRHNDDTLIRRFNNDKLGYLTQFYFTICPENSNCMGYVTEKIFHAIASGCIPIYWGSYNKPELDVLNQDAIIFWDKDGDNEVALKKIKELISTPKLMKAFLEQPRLLPGAEDYIRKSFQMIEKKFLNLV